MNALSRHQNGKPTGDTGDPNRLSRMQSGRTLLPALIALGGGTLLAAGPAAALQLGELRVQSSLGHPLRASIAYALNPTEQIQSHCIHLGRAASGLPAISNARVSIVDNVIHIAGRAPVNEPLIALALNVDCPGTAHLTREYTAFVDPAGADAPAETPSAARTAPAPETAVTRDPVSRTAATTRAPAEPAEAAEPVAAGTYRVQSGDSLSGIAARITNRRMRLWDTVDALFAANPGAFIDGNRDLLLAGSDLVIPAAVLEPGNGAVVSARAAEPAPPAATASRQATPDPATQQAPTATETGAAGAGEQPAQPTAAESTATAPAGSSAAATAGSSAAAEPRQGDVSLDADGPFVSPIEPDAVATPATSAERAAPSTPERPAATRPAFNPRPDGAGSRTWLMWLAGSGAALILALVLFGRQLKQRFGSAATSLYGSRNAEGEDTTVVARVDPDADSLDVEMEDAGDLDDSGDIDLAQEFGYTMSGELSGRSEDVSDSTAILESEILPSDETGEYDLSMIVDATQQELPDAEDTTKNLRAIQLDEDKNENEGTSQDEYTLEEEIDYKILEQDYQDELTATQALNAELARAAAEMSLEMEVDDATAVLEQEAGINDTDDATTALPADPDNASAPTVKMPRTDNESAATEPPAGDDREDTRADEDLSSTMGDAQNDPTAETAETKKLRAS